MGRMGNPSRSAVYSKPSILPLRRSTGSGSRPAQRRRPCLLISAEGAVVFELTRKRRGHQSQTVDWRGFVDAPEFSLDGTWHHRISFQESGVDGEPSAMGRAA
jgi:hypothetical protein